jgi:hypothetical protein
MLAKLSSTARALVLATAVLTVAGIADEIFVNGIAAAYVATILFGVAGVLVVSLLFLLVGESEDRERSRTP